MYADTVLYNGRIYTQNRQQRVARSVAIRDRESGEILRDLDVQDFSNVRLLDDGRFLVIRDREDDDCVELVGADGQEIWGVDLPESGAIFDAAFISQMTALIEGLRADHPDAVLVVGGSGSYPIATALAGWKSGFDDTREGRAEAGVEFSFFKPEIGGASRFRINFRNHRKIVVVVGRLAFEAGQGRGVLDLQRVARRKAQRVGRLLEHHCASPIAKEHAGVPVGPVGDA